MSVRQTAIFVTKKNTLDLGFSGSMRFSASMLFCWRCLYGVFSSVMINRNVWPHFGRICLANYLVSWLVGVKVGEKLFKI